MSDFSLSSAWSPLMPIAELPRQPLHTTLTLPSQLSRPVSQVGLFWTAGSPDALASEITEERAEFHVARTEVSGGFRRPLDPGIASHTFGSGIAWGRLGQHGAGIGHVLVDRANYAEGSFANVSNPYATEPYAVLDTLGEPTSERKALLEGAGGWALGRISIGVGLGYSSREVRTIESAVPRIHTTVSPGVTVGLGCELVAGRLHLSTYGRLQQTAEQIQIYSLAASSRVYQLEGYREPVRTDLTATWFSERFERSAWAHGVAIGGDVAGTTWTLFAQQEHRSSSNFNATISDASEDQWEADGWSAGGAAQRVFFKGDLHLTLATRLATLSGDARYHGVEGVPFAADESRLSTLAEARIRPGHQLEVMASIRLDRERRERNDGVAEVFSDLRVWRPMTTIEVARWLSSTLAVAIGGAFAEHNPAGTLPFAADLGAAYVNWIAPELALEAAAAQAKAVAATVLWQSRERTSFWIKGQYKSSSPIENGTISLQHRPAGDRIGWSVAAGVVLGGR